MVKELVHAFVFLADGGKMYACDERFKKNIDKYGEGTAEFAVKAITVYRLL
jgi:hypothetical protein